MKSNDFEFIIGSPFDREKLICEIYYKNKITGEISQECSELILEIYPSSTELFEIPLEKFQKALDEAKNHLINGNSS